MQYKDKSSQSRILPVVITGFSYILLAMGIFWIISTQQMKNISDVIAESRIIVKKMDIVALMTEVARARTRLTMLMVYTEDIFKRDEIGMQLNSKATEFAVLRQQLLATGMNEKEMSILNRQSKYIRSALMRQREAAELALSDDEKDRNKAGIIVLNEVYPSQGRVMDHFMELLTLQKAELDSIAQQSQNNHETNTAYNKSVLALIALGSLFIIMFMSRNIRAVENQLNREKVKAQVTLHSIGDGVITVNQEGNIETINQVATNIIGGSASHLIGLPISNLFDDDTTQIDNSRLIQESIKQVLMTGNQLTEHSNIRFGLKNKPDMVLKANVSPILDDMKQVLGVVISFHDITNTQALIKKMRYQASHDSLTGLYNRRAFEEKVKRMGRQFDSGVTFAFCIIDLDQFKVVNDSVGHAAGDELLRQLPELMKPVTNKNDLLSRLGGDEFGLFLYDVTALKAINIAKKILHVIECFELDWDGNIYRISASIGIVYIPSVEMIDYEYLYQSADSACYTAKSEGRNQIHLVQMNEDLQSKRIEESERLQYLTKSIEQGHFILYGQLLEPLSTRSTGLKYTEVLLRLKDKKGNIIQPDTIIPVAERYGLMANIDLRVLQQVCNHIAATPMDDMVYAVNLSGHSLSSREHMKEMLHIIKRRKITPGRLCLEVTESVAISNLEIARDFISVLQDYGCYFALDDFGSGLSSFYYLNNLPLDYIKIDGAFVKSMLEDRVSLATVETIHTIGKKLGLLTIAEYVENEEQVRALQKMGIDMAQGFYFDIPSELDLLN